jgi:hypothetical protein
MSADQKVRVQFDFSPEAYEELNELQSEVHASTKAEVVRYALRTLQWLMSEIKLGRRILVEDAGSTQEVVFSFLTRNGREKATR